MLLPDYKKNIRKQIKELKSKLTANEVDSRTKDILENFYKLDCYKECNRLYTYINYNEEVNTTLLIEDALASGKTVCVPRVEDDRMEFYEITNLDNLIESSYHIPEPNPAIAVKDEVHEGLMIMPGLAFDKFHHRIGYGGGFYDKYLEKYKSFKKVALCYDFQVFDYLETMEHDIEVDMVVTQKNIF